MPTPPADIVLYAYDSSGTGFNPTAIAGEWTLEQDDGSGGRMDRARAGPGRGESDDARR